MGETQIQFHNKIKIKVQAQIFVDATLICTCLVGPGEVGILPAEAERYDLFVKDGATGWELVRKLDGAAKTVTLTQQNGRCVIA